MHLRLPVQFTVQTSKANRGYQHETDSRIKDTSKDPLGWTYNGMKACLKTALARINEETL